MIFPETNGREDVGQVKAGNGTDACSAFQSKIDAVLVWPKLQRQQLVFAAA